MAKDANKTTPTAISVADFIGAVPDARRRDEAQVLDALLQRVTGQQAKMWGPSIVGYGSYDYRYDSGRTGTSCRIGFSPRKAQLVVYLVPELDGEAAAQAEALFARLGPHSLGKACLYIRRLDAIDMAALESLLALAWQEMASRYPA